ncbi:hypothetical protein [Oryzibacter oryziterrae]|uniref:hypothetical protein n=1 Tax=Oryzibacter oryziterrae TaxID=2766474 RepID=UPI001F44ADB3|nr:hypothetical protein [Oryzibacter oryziterrae]
MPFAFQYLSGNCTEIFGNRHEILKNPIVISRKTLSFLSEATENAPSPEQIKELIAQGLRAIILTANEETDIISKTSAALAVAEALAGVDEGHVEIIALVAGAGAAMSLPWRQLPSKRLTAIGLAPELLETHWGPSPATKVNPALDLVAANVLLTAASHRLLAFVQQDDDSSRFHARWHGFTHYLS